MKADNSLKRTMIAAAAVILVATLAAQAQSTTPGPEHQKAHVWLGNWEWEEEIRDSPTDGWYKATWSGQARLMPGGFFVEFRWKGKVKGNAVEVVEIEGYHPLKKANVTSIFSSDGTMGNVTSAIYTGNTEKVRYNTIDAQGQKLEARCTWNFASDSMSASGSCEQLTDGKWWLFRKIVKANKTQ